MGWQVHGTELSEWREAPERSGFASSGAELARVDGHLTDRPGLGLLVLVADCYPVAPGRAAGGWRCSTAAGAGSRAASSSAPSSASTSRRPPRSGPGIGGCCYEVGEEVLGAFADLEGVADGRMLDLREVIARKLEAAGVSAVEHVDECTSCAPERYFSHRRDDGVTGRQAGLAVGGG